MLLPAAMDVDLFDQWITFSKRVAPGTRLWIDDKLFDRLWFRLEKDSQVSGIGDPWKPFGGYRIDFRGSYRHGGVSYFPRRSYAALRTPDAR